jgi:predicted RNA-binding protein associated with RNAse of E/G family
MITVIKQDSRGTEKTRYQGEIVERLANGVVISALWTRPAKDLGYITFEPGDIFIEYYYTDRWFNIFDVASAVGIRKGWYCNVAAPAEIADEKIKQLDLLLDVWVYPNGKLLILDEDEFAADTQLTAQQREQATEGLHAVLAMIAARQEVFAAILDHTVP